MERCTGTGVCKVVGLVLCTGICVGVSEGGTVATGFEKEVFTVLVFTGLIR